MLVALKPHLDHTGEASQDFLPCGWSFGLTIIAVCPLTRLAYLDMSEIQCNSAIKTT